MRSSAQSCSASRSRFADAWLERSRVAPMTYVGCLPAKDAATSFLIFSPSHALSIEQTHFLKVCLGNKRHETNTISRDRGDKLADYRHATSDFNSRDDAQYVSTFLDDH